VLDRIARIYGTAFCRIDLCLDEYGNAELENVEMLLIKAAML
jgi:hypothetical protein